MNRVRDNKEATTWLLEQAKASVKELSAKQGPCPLHEQLREVSANLKQEECAAIIKRNLQAFNDLSTLDIIQAMIVLPFEHKRMGGVLSGQQQIAFKGELQFWLYHLRDVQTALSKCSDRQSEIDTL